MRRIHFLCLGVLASALKPPRRQAAAVRPLARAPVAKASILGVPTVPRGGGRPIPWGRAGLLTWSVLAYWAYALKQIYLAGGRAAVLSKETLGPAACAIAGYFLLANLPELTGV